MLYDRGHSAISLAGPEEYDIAKALAGVTWLHVTGITPAISETACRANLAIVQQAKQAGAQVSCDLNFRKKLWNWRPGTAPKAPRPRAAAVLPCAVDLVIANEEDAADVLGIHASGHRRRRGTINADAYEEVARRSSVAFPNVSPRRHHVAREHLGRPQQLGSDALLDVATHKLVSHRPTRRVLRPTKSATSSIASARAILRGLLFALSTPELLPPTKPSPSPSPPAASSIRSRGISTMLVWKK